MTQIKVRDQEFAALRQFLADVSGITLGENKAYLLETRLGSLVLETGCNSFSEFHQRLKYGGDAKLLENVVNLMTTNETLWFRDAHPFGVLKEKLLPEYAAEARQNRRNSLRIWSAACSTGQEPYSIAMTIQETMSACPDLKRLRVEILASDISTHALRLAKLGRYEALAMSRGLPEAYRERFFSNEGRVWSIAPEIRNMVTLKKLNLRDSFAPLGRFDIIFCRNVAIYFSDTFKTDLFARMAAVLNTNGVLFLGASESLINYCSAFDMHSGPAGGVHYRLRGNVERTSV